VSGPPLKITPSPAAPDTSPARVSHPIKAKPVQPAVAGSSPPGGGSAGGSAGQPAALPADLNQSWRGLMNALGVGLPNGLNRSVRVTRRLHRAVS
jgi:hypothetical protein